MSQTKTRDKLDPAVVGMPLETILKKYVARFGERKPDWHAFADAAIDGWRRAQHRFIGNTSGKPDENFIPAGSGDSRTRKTRSKPIRRIFQSPSRLTYSSA